METTETGTPGTEAQLPEAPAEPAEPTPEENPAEEADGEAETVIYQQIDYTEKFDSILAAIERLETAIEEQGAESVLDSGGIGFIEGRANLTDIFRCCC